MLKIAICDDNPQCLGEAKQFIYDWSIHTNIPITIHTFRDGDSLLEHYEKEQLDIMFLDIVMPLLNGMEVAQEIRRNDSSTKIVFFTSSPEFAVESYDVKATGYLLKPLNYLKLCDVLNDCVLSLNKEPEHIVVKTLHGYQKIYLHTIECLEAQNKKVIFFLRDGSSCEVLETFSNYVDKLTLEKGFFKCHRSYIVYIPNIDQFNSTEIRTKSNICIPIARGYSKTFKDAYFNYMFTKGND